jgi:hypothetical protein
MTGEWPEHEVDHKNRDPSDNRWGNLRDATRSLNNTNAYLHANSTSGRKGASWNKQYQKWEAKISVNGRTHFLGRFDSIVGAHRAYVIAAIKHFGEYAQTWSREDERLTKEILNKIIKERVPV